MHGIFCNSHMHVGSGGLMFLLLLLSLRLRSSPLFVDSINNFRSKAHNIEVFCYGYVSPACFEHLGCCGLEIKGEQFFDHLTVCEGMN